MSEEKSKEELSREELIRLLSSKDYKIRILEGKLRKNENILKSITVIIVSVISSVSTIIVMRMFS